MQLVAVIKPMHSQRSFSVLPVRAAAGKAPLEGPSGGGQGSPGSLCPSGNVLITIHCKSHVAYGATGGKE